MEQDERDCKQIQIVCKVYLNFPMESGSIETNIENVLQHEK